jgi:hypothetical protein
MALANNGANKKLINQASLTRASSRCSQVIGSSKYKPIGSDRNKSMISIQQGTGDSYQ